MCVAVAMALAAPATATAGEDVLVWPRRPTTALDGVDAALRAAGHRPRDFVKLRARMIAEDEAHQAAARVAWTAVEQALAAARAAFLAQRYDDMIAALLRGETDALAAATAGPTCSAPLWELQFQLGLAYTARDRPGDAELARARFALALALDPERRPVAALYGPDVSLAFLKVVDEVASRPARPLRVDVAPTDAQLTVDCHPLAPPTGVRPGLHVVRVGAPGHLSTASILLLGDDPSLQLRLAVDPAPTPGPWWIRGALDPASASARAVVQAVAGPVRVVWLDEVDGVHVARLVQDGQLRRVARADLPGDAAVQVLAADAPPPSDPPPPPRPRRRTALILGLTGAALGSLALGLGLGLGLRDPASARLQLVVR